MVLSDSDDSVVTHVGGSLAVQPTLQRASSVPMGGGILHRSPAVARKVSEWCRCRMVGFIIDRSASRHFEQA